MPLHFDIELDPLTHVIDVRRETTGFNCYPTDSDGTDPLQRLYRKSDGAWTFQATLRSGTQPQFDWRGPVDSDGTRPVLYYTGLDGRYGRVYTESGGGSYGNTIWRAGAVYARVPNSHSDIWAAAIYRDPGTNARKLRILCWRGTSPSFAVYQRTDGASETQSTNYPTDPDAWQLLGSFTYADLIGSHTQNLRHAYAHWNESGTALVGMIGIECNQSSGWIECVDNSSGAGCYDRKMLFRMDVAGLAGSVTVTQLGEQGRVRLRSVETDSYTEEAGETICTLSPVLTLQEQTTTLEQSLTFLDENIVAADWKGDDLVYARVSVVEGPYLRSRYNKVTREDAPAGCLTYIYAQYDESETGSSQLLELSGFAETVRMGAYQTAGWYDYSLNQKGASGLVTQFDKASDFKRISSGKVIWADLRYGAILYEQYYQRLESSCVDGITNETETISVKLHSDSGSITLYESETTSSYSYSGCKAIGDPYPLVAFGGYGNSTTDQYTCIGWPTISIRNGSYCRQLYSADIDDSGKFPFISCRVNGTEYKNILGALNPATLYGLDASPRFTKIKWVGR